MAFGFNMGVLGATGSVKYTANAVSFDGTNDYLTRGAGLTGAADSRTGIFSAWIRLDAGNGAEMDLLENTNGTLQIFRNTSNNKFRFVVSNTGLTSNFDCQTVNAYTSGATWYHILMSWDTNHASSAKIGQIYISDVSDKTVNFDGQAAFDIDYTQANWYVASDNTAANKVNGALAEVYFAPGQYLDFSVTGNRRLFIDSLGKPVNLGATGSTPTGTAPLIYLKNPSASVGTNSGTGGNFTINGAPATASTSPST